MTVTQRCQASRRMAAAMLGLGLGLSIVAAAPALAAPPLSLAEVLRMALSTNPDLRVQQTATEVARGQQLQAAGQFDTVLNANVNFSKLIGTTPDERVPQHRALSTGYGIGLYKQARNGATLGATLDTTSYLDSALGGTQSPASATVGLSLTLPLLRGRGAREVAAAEDAAALMVQASDLTLRDNTAQVLYRTLSAYWNYSVQLALETVARSSEARSRALLESTRKLVDAAERPRADLVLLQADLADRVSAREAASLAVSDARTTLGRLLGLDAVAIAVLGEPREPLPAIVDIGMPGESELARLRAAALERRPDLLALGAQGAAAERYAQAAHHQLLPVLDLDVGLQYAKLNDNGRHFPYPGDAGRVQQGPSIVARLNFQFPVQNTTARGLVRERDANVEQVGIRRRDLADAVASGVDSALHSLAASSAQLKVAQEALGLYELAVSQEIVKQRNGISTLIDVINVETRFINARTGVLLTHLAYANAIARLRFETGTLLPAVAARSADGERFDLDLAALAGLGPMAAALHVSPP